MPILAANYTLNSKIPNFTRDQFKTIQVMKELDPDFVDEGHMAYCIETGKHYEFLSTNPFDDTYGHWREFCGGGILTLGSESDLLLFPNPKLGLIVYLINETEDGLGVGYHWWNGTQWIEFHPIDTTAIHPGDNISELVNDKKYVTLHEIETFDNGLFNKIPSFDINSKGELIMSIEDLDSKFWFKVDPITGQLYYEILTEDDEDIDLDINDYPKD